MSGNAQQVRVGPGWLYYAPLGTTEPTDLVTGWPVGWIQLGFTKGGHEVDDNVTYNPLTVEEVLGPIGMAATDRDLHVKFELAQVTATMMQLALNGGSVTGTGNNPRYWEPPALGAELGVMLGWQATDALERAVFRNCLQIGSVNTNRKKAPDYATLPVDFRCLEVSGAKPYARIFDHVLA